MKTILLFLLLLTSSITLCQTYGNGATDIDGNTYTSVVIGSQEWLVENLKTTRYANGDLISHIPDALEWENASTGAWVYYDNNSSYNEIYGKLYNWYAFTDNRNICPDGWRASSHSDWQTLQNYLGGGYWQGGKLKDYGTSTWADPNAGATNEYGFTALPGGSREKAPGNGFVFEGLSNYGYYWSTWNSHPTTRKRWEFRFGENILAPFSIDINDGYSCRCIKGETLSNGDNSNLPSISKIYPNPTKSDITIVISNNQIGEKFKIYDTLGRIILSGKFSGLENNISLSAFKSGIYILSFGNSSKTIVKK